MQKARRFGGQALIAAAFLLLNHCGGGGGGRGGGHSGGIPQGVFQGKVIYSVSAAGSPMLGISVSAQVEGEGIGGAKVEIEGLPFSAITDAEGNFKIHNIPPGQYNASANKDSNNDGISDYTGTETLVMPPDRGAEININANSNGTVLGRVTLDGATSRNIGIMVFVPGSSSSAFTDDEGNYRLDGVPCPKTTATIAATKACYSVEQVEVWVPNCGSDVEGVNLDLKYVGCPAPAPQTGGIKGNAFLLGQTNHSGILVSLSGGAAAVTSPDGRYEFTGLGTGVYHLTASMPGYSSASFSNITVMAGGTYFVPDLWLVSLSDPDCDGDGSPNIQDLNDDNDGYPDAEEIAFGSEICDPNSVPLGDIAGVVFKSGTSDPLFGALAGVAGTDKVAVTDISGQFAILDVHAGTKTLVGIMNGYENGSTVVNVVSGQTAYATIYLSPLPFNTPPSAEITSPSSGLEITRGANLNFSGLVLDDEDAEEELAVRWISSIDGLVSSASADLTGLTIFSSNSLSAGTHLITLRVTDSGGLSGDDHVAISVNDESPVNPILCVTPLSLDFGSTGNARTVTVFNCGTGTLAWSITGNRTWLSTTPGTGSLAGGEFLDVTVSVDRSNLQFMVSYSGALAVQSNGGNNLIAVKMTTPCGDRDGDGYNDAACGQDDCDDGNLNVHPDALEICNGVDDDCDLQTDENTDALCDDGDPCTGVELCSLVTRQCETGPVEYCLEPAANLTAQAIEPSVIQLSWTDNAIGEDGQEVYRSESESGPFAKITTLGPDVNACFDVGLSQSTVYYYYVRAYKAAEFSLESNVDSATTPSLAAPVLESLTPGKQTFHLVWQKGDDFADNFEIERARVLAGATVEPYAVVGTVAGDMLAWLDKSPALAEGATYFYRLRAKDDAGNYSPLSNEKAARLGLNWLGFDIRVIDTIHEPFSVTSADFDKDGSQDLAYAEPADIYVLQGDGDGNFTQMETFHQPTGTFHPMLWYGFYYEGYIEDTCMDQDFYCGQFMHRDVEGSCNYDEGGPEITNSSIIARDLNEDSYPDLFISGWFWKRHSYTWSAYWSGGLDCIPPAGTCCLDDDISTSGNCLEWSPWPVPSGMNSCRASPCEFDFSLPTEGPCCNSWSECLNPVAVSFCYTPLNYYPGTITYTRQYMASYLGGGDFSFNNGFLDTNSSGNDFSLVDLDSDGQNELVTVSDRVAEDFQGDMEGVNCMYYDHSPYSFEPLSSAVTTYQPDGGAFTLPDTVAYENTSFPSWMNY